MLVAMEFQVDLGVGGVEPNLGGIEIVCTAGLDLKQVAVEIVEI